MMPLQLTIRRAQPEDIPQIVAIERMVFTDPWGEKTLRESLDLYPDTFFVAQSNGDLAGFVAAAIEDIGDELYGHIMNIAVAPKYQRCGIGRRLIRRLEQECIVAGASGVQLEVRITNTGAQEFYRRLGYREVFQVARYYTNEEDALVMMKWFRF
ncbi:MAG TPA: ribosomal protein S18-alanine N-acetyltransferase [Candidatus Methanoculleus thermohydrogenotrophicum]|nr:ribosomal protein S18-alanine N-acetyltransferase [Candidatus Methanoculleus thermohydrogenotrophicum]HOB17764.1 ribosomal protein S18-alanine N-acetyltransferase [Candidatus Methanoculleus thermohydrogenotrophicum]HPZ37877.1 ribosomal protein S18-alanine N-acetyltransferase [Candidatus Methanoculleus thermohydrogenotrophicum]HQC90757.1 ribosomal protein S18-alanine N-acetyltransferase [Candidatus Methanoculleus thermohydrogenotrophicum]